MVPNLGLGVSTELARRFAASGLPGSAPRATGTVDVSKLPADSSAYYAGNDWNKFISDYGPLLEKQLASLDSMEMVKQAEKDAAVTPGLMSGAIDRAAARRGGVTATQRAALDAGRALTTATNTADTLNNARIDQRTRNTEAALKLSGLGTNIYQMGLDNVRESEGLAAQRRMNNAASKEAWKSSMLSGATTLGSAALFAFAM